MRSPIHHGESLRRNACPVQFVSATTEAVSRRERDNSLAMSMRLSYAIYEYYHYAMVRGLGIHDARVVSHIA